MSLLDSNRCFGGKFRCRMMMMMDDIEMFKRWLVNIGGLGLGAVAVA